MEKEKIEMEVIGEWYHKQSKYKQIIFDILMIFIHPGVCSRWLGYTGYKKKK